MKKITLKLKKGQWRSWDEIFENPHPISIEILKTGTVIINRRGTLNSTHPRASDVKDEELEVPILAYLVHHEDSGYYLLDAGLDASYYKDPLGGIKEPLADEFLEEKNENIAFQLEERKIQIKGLIKGNSYLEEENQLKRNSNLKEGNQLKGVFLSHLHPDHIAGIRELPHDIPYVVGKGEFDEYEPELYGDFLNGVETIYEIDFKELDELPILGATADLLGDGSLLAVWTPGHTHGHFSFLVNAFDGPVFLTMDACFIYENLERGVAPSEYTWDVQLAQRTLEKIILFLKEYPQVKVVCGHEYSKKI